MNRICAAFGLFFLLHLFHPVAWASLEADVQTDIRSHIERVALSSNEAANELADRIVAAVKTAHAQDQDLVVAFLHPRSNGNDVNRYQKRAIEVATLKLTDLNLAHRLQLEPIIVNEEEYEGAKNKLIQMAPASNTIDHMILDYEQKAHTKLNQNSKNGLKSFFAVKTLTARLNAFRDRLFGLETGFTFFTHFKRPRGISPDLIGRIHREVKNSLFSAVIGAISYSAATTVAWIGDRPVLQFGSPAHLVSTALLSNWIFWTLYYLPEFNSLKSQGKDFFIPTTALKGSPHGLVKNNFLTFNLYCTIQELILYSALSATYTLKDPGHLARLDTWVFVGVISVFAAFTYSPAEFYFSDEFSRIATLKGKAERLRELGYTERAQNLELQSQKLFKKTIAKVYVWWMGIYPVLSSGSLVLSMYFLNLDHQSHSLLSSIENMVKQNFLLVPVGVAGIAANIWARRETIKAFFKSKTAPHSCSYLLMSARAPKTE